MIINSNKQRFHSAASEQRCKWDVFYVNKIIRILMALSCRQSIKQTKALIIQYVK